MQQNIYYLHFCHNVIRYRKKYGLSYPKMAKLMGISSHILKQIEAGVMPKKLNLDILFQLHALSGVSPAEWLMPEWTVGTMQKVPIPNPQKNSNDI